MNTTECGGKQCPLCFLSSSLQHCPVQPRPQMRDAGWHGSVHPCRLQMQWYPENHYGQQEGTIPRAWSGDQDFQKWVRAPRTLHWHCCTLKELFFLPQLSQGDGEQEARAGGSCIPLGSLELIKSFFAGKWRGNSFGTFLVSTLEWELERDWSRIFLNLFPDSTPWAKLMTSLRWKSLL